MNTGKTLFAQLMDFLPWTTFDRIVARYNGNRAVRSLPCTAQYQAMAFAQITYRESLRDIEACLSAQSAKLYHMGFRQPVRRSTLSDANDNQVTLDSSGITHARGTQQVVVGDASVDTNSGALEVT